MIEDFHLENLDKTRTKYEMELSAEKTDLMAKAPMASKRRSKYRYLKQLQASSALEQSILVKEHNAVFSRIAQATATLIKLNSIWRYNCISLGSKVKLLRSLVYPYFSMHVTLDLDSKIR